MEQRETHRTAGAFSVCVCVRVRYTANGEVSVCLDYLMVFLCVCTFNVCVCV